MVEDEGAIRKVKSGDIHDLSTLIKNTLLISNSLDYNLSVIRNLSRQYSPANVADMALRRDMYIHTKSGRINGTVSLKNDTIYAFFVAPDMQHRGIGTQLLNYVEKMAHSRGFPSVKVGASVTAKRFYEKNGYKTVRKEGDGSFGDVFYMEKLVEPFSGST